MKKQLPLLILSVIALAISACSTGYSTYKHGDYYKACLEAIKRGSCFFIIGVLMFFYILITKNGFQPLVVYC
jgi:hypothetical protein